VNVTHQCHGAEIASRRVNVRRQSRCASRQGIPSSHNGRERLAPSEPRELPSDLQEKLERVVSVSLLHHVVPTDALRGRGRPGTPIVRVGIAALGPDGAILHQSGVPGGRDIKHGRGAPSEHDAGLSRGEGSSRRCSTSHPRMTDPLRGRSARRAAPRDRGARANEACPKGIRFMS
jgi:hypothetical protein